LDGAIQKKAKNGQVLQTPKPAGKTVEKPVENRLRNH
jgi:hypothetical protein